MEQESANNNYAEDYYVEAFHKLEKENENSWNFGAAIGGTAWLIYRKMYAYAFLFTLLDIFTIFMMNMVAGENFGHVYFLIAFPIRVFVFGHYGNRVYYEIVKEKISKGYHLLEKYHLFSNSLVIVAVLLLWLA
ncbi:MAG: DUF2628 domain-containing protein [Alphaproteobacteria bacterium]|nr:DUF2628 domain-containing protein [Alphaproteobacteria bacterium]